MRRVAAILLAVLALAGCLGDPRASPDVALPVTVPTLPTAPSTLVTPSPTPPTTSQPPPAEPSVLRNGGFERGVDGWTLQGDRVAVDCAHPRSGECALAIGHDGPATSAWQEVPAGATRFMRLTFASRDPAQVERPAGWFTVTLDAVDANGSVVGTSRMVWEGADPTPGWREQSLTLGIASPAATLRVTFAAGPGPSDATTWIDDAALSVSDYPGPAFANGGFEEGSGATATGWSASRDCSEAHEGSCSMVLWPGTVAAQGFGPSGPAFQLAYWEKGSGLAQPGSGALYLNVTFWGAKGERLGGEAGMHDLAPDAWQRSVFPDTPIIVPEGTEKVSLILAAYKGAGAAGSWRVDDLSIDWGS